MRFFAALLAATTLLTVGRLARADDLRELAARSKPGVVLLTRFDDKGHRNATGTGFFISGDGWLVTNHHVIKEAARMTATLSDESVREVSGVYADNEADDLAILKVDGSGFVPLPLGSSTELKVGDPIAVIGSPLGLSTALSDGIISAIREQGLKLDGFNAPQRSWKIQITAPISHGSSGSPVLDRKGSVVAVAVAVAPDGQSVNFTIPVELVQTLRATIGDPPRIRSFRAASGQEIWRNVSLSAGIFLAIAAAIFLWGRVERRAKATPSDWRRRATAPSRDDDDDDE